MLAPATWLGLLLAAAPASPPMPAAPEIRWQAPPGCPDEATVRGEITAALAQLPGGAGQVAQISLRVELLPGGRWRLEATITRRDGQGQRQLEAERCEELAEAAALLAVIAAAPEQDTGAWPSAGAAGSPEGQPGAAGESQGLPGTGAPPQPGPPLGPRLEAGAPPQPGPPLGPRLEAGAPPEAPERAQGPGQAGEGRPPGPQVAPEPPEEPLSGPAPAVDAVALEPELPAEGQPRANSRPEPRVRATLGLGAGVGVGALPGATGLLRASVGVRGRRWGAALTQSFWLPRDLPAADNPAVGGRMWLAATGLRGCGIPGKGRVEVPLCAGIEVGALRGSGLGDLSRVNRATSVWAAASAGPALHVRVAPRVALTLGVDLLVMLTRPRFEVSGGGEVCCSAAAGMTAAAGVELRLP